MQFDAVGSGQVLGLLRSDHCVASTSAAATTSRHKTVQCVCDEWAIIENVIGQAPTITVASHWLTQTSDFTQFPRCQFPQ